MCSQPLITEMSYMVYGEKLNTFDESRKDILEFQNAASAFVESTATLITEPPFYKYIPTKTYRRFVQAISHIHEYGMFMLIHVCIHWVV